MQPSEAYRDEVFGKDDDLSACIARCQPALQQGELEKELTASGRLLDEAVSPLQILSGSIRCRIRCLRCKLAESDLERASHGSVRPTACEVRKWGGEAESSDEVQKQEQLLFAESRVNGRKQRAESRVGGARGANWPN